MLILAGNAEFFLISLMQVSIFRTFSDLNSNLLVTLDRLTIVIERLRL